MGIEISKDNFIQKYFCDDWRPFWPTSVSKECAVPKPTPLKPEDFPPEMRKNFKHTPGVDPRFQQTDQTLRCYVMYTDFYRCQKILGADNKPCEWFKETYKAICPNEWIEKFDYRRTRKPSIFPWHKGISQGDLPGHCYGDDYVDKKQFMSKRITHN
ncbi:uncharacterized protein [Chelonus insularis]|uniref:uncharacterized protein n=1 Tax=Chelonus insularis TaxID=460826 RepID=UPI00158B4F47|nr:uncharacterized protein LOC118074282 [Chelonus insularis]